MNISTYYDDYWTAANGWKPTDALDAELRWWLDQVSQEGRCILDVGCGDGTRYASYLTSKKMCVSGVDVSAAAVAEARRHGVDAEIVTGDGSLPHPDRKFDVVLCFEVFEHLFDPEQTLREMIRVAKPGAQLLISVPNIGHWRSRIEHLIFGRLNPGGSPATGRDAPWRDPHIRFFCRASLHKLMEGFGCRITRSGGLDLQFLNSAPGLRCLTRPRMLRPFALGCEAIARRLPRLLAGRCIILAETPSA
jgi:methionine biosynthesis protein MetW